LLGEKKVIVALEAGVTNIGYLTLVSLADSEKQRFASTALNPACRINA